MASTTCWDCETFSHMTPVDGSVSVRSGALRERVMACFRCDNCAALNIAMANQWMEHGDPLKWLTAKRNLVWKPLPEPEQPEWDFPDVPLPIASAASEAYECWYHADANRAAVIMARAVIEATAKDKGIKKGTLLDKIDAMSHLVREHVRRGAHEVRLLGNDMAHGDLGEEVTDEDAELVLTLMSKVLDDVYQSPAEVARAEAAREARKRQQAAQARLLAKAAESMASGQKPLTVTVVDGKVVTRTSSASSASSARPQSDQAPLI
jgi:hypothetical protein